MTNTKPSTGYHLLPMTNNVAVFLRSKESRKWKRVLLRFNTHNDPLHPDKEVAKFINTGDAYAYAKKLANRIDSGDWHTYPAPMMILVK